MNDRRVYEYSIYKWYVWGKKYMCQWIFFRIPVINCTYIVKNDVNRDDLLIVLIAAFLGRYNFAQSRFLVELIPNCGERLILIRIVKKYVEICQR